MACCNTSTCNTCNNTCNSGSTLFGNDLWIWIIVIALVVILFGIA